MTKHQLGDNGCVEAVAVAEAAVWQKCVVVETARREAEHDDEKRDENAGDEGAAREGGGQGGDHGDHGDHGDNGDNGDHGDTSARQLETGTWHGCICVCGLCALYGLSALALGGFLCGFLAFGGFR